MMIEVIQFKIEYRFTDVFDKHSFGEAYFAGTMRKIATATAEGLPIKNGIGWEAQVSQMPNRATGTTSTTNTTGGIQTGA